LNQAPEAEDLRENPRQILINFELELKSEMVPIEDIFDFH